MPTCAAANCAERSPHTRSGTTNIDLEQRLQRRIQFAAAVQLERRNPQALLIDFRRIRGVRTRHATADIGVMADHDRECATPLIGENRHEHEHVGQMHAAVIGIVHDDDIAVMQIAAEFRQHRLHRLGDGAEVLGDGLGLRHHLSVGRAKRRGEIHHVLDDLRARDAHDGIGHVIGDRIETALDHRESDRIDFHAASPNSITTLPMSSRCTVALPGTTIVASNSSITSGPAAGSSDNVDRSTTATAIGRVAALEGNRASFRTGCGRPDLDAGLCRSRAAARVSRVRSRRILTSSIARLIAVTVGLEILGDKAFLHRCNDIAGILERGPRVRSPGPRAEDRPPNRARCGRLDNRRPQAMRSDSSASSSIVTRSDCAVRSANGRSNVRRPECARSLASMPTALNTPDSTGMTIRLIPSWRATSIA